MGSLFNLLSLDSVYICLIIIGITFIIGLIYTLIISIKCRATKSFFITSILMPMIVASVISMISLFLTDNSATGAVRIATVAVALGLIRFRSANARAEELLLLFGGVAFGLISGLGYVVIASIIAIVLSLLYVLLSSVNFLKFKRVNEEKLLKITIPEDLNYNEAFDAILKTYLKSYELVEIKTTGMGSLFRLSYKVELLTKDNEKALIDEIRIKNSNLEISLLPYVESNKSL